MVRFLGANDRRLGQMGRGLGERDRDRWEVQRRISRRLNLDMSGQRRRRATAPLKETALKCVLIADVATAACKDVGVDLVLRIAVEIDATCKYTLCAGSSIWAAANSSMRLINHTMRTG